MKTLLLCSVAGMLGMLGAQASATTISWTDWTTEVAGTVVGNLSAPGGPVTVTYTGPYNFAQTNGGIAYWSAGTYNGSYNQPSPASDIIALSDGGTKTISFSSAVNNPYIALMSWNGNTVDFGTTIEVVAEGCGYWGCGTMVLNGGQTGFYGQGEVHGIIRLPGTFTSITFIDTSEGWHGFTLGVAAVPEPASWALLIAGFGLVGATLRSKRRRQTAAT